MVNFSTWNFQVHTELKTENQQNFQNFFSHADTKLLKFFSYRSEIYSRIYGKNWLLWMFEISFTSKLCIKSKKIFAIKLFPQLRCAINDLKAFTLDSSWFLRGYKYANKSDDVQHEWVDQVCWEIFAINVFPQLRCNANLSTRVMLCNRNESTKNAWEIFVTSCFDQRKLNRITLVK